MITMQCQSRGRHCAGTSDQWLPTPIPPPPVRTRTISSTRQAPRKAISAVPSRPPKLYPNRPARKPPMSAPTRPATISPMQPNQDVHRVKHHRGDNNDSHHHATAPLLPLCWLVIRILLALSIPDSRPDQQMQSQVGKSQGNHSGTPAILFRPCPDGLMSLTPRLRCPTMIQAGAAEARHVLSYR